MTIIICAKIQGRLAQGQLAQDMLRVNWLRTSSGSTGSESTGSGHHHQQLLNNHVTIPSLVNRKTGKVTFKKSLIAVCRHKVASLMAVKLKTLQK